MVAMPYTSALDPVAAGFSTRRFADGLAPRAEARWNLAFWALAAGQRDALRDGRANRIWAGVACGWTTCQSTGARRRDAPCRRTKLQSALRGRNCEQLARVEWQRAEQLEFGELRSSRLLSDALRLRPSYLRLQ